MRGEFDFIRLLRRHALKRVSTDDTHPSLLKGIGDDAALLRPARGFDLCVTADLLVEGVDFRLETTRPRLLGHKALAVSLSDVAAMGARPRWALVTLGVPRALWAGKFLEEFYAGLFALADAHGVALVGGDLSRTSPAAWQSPSSEGPLVIDSIVLGEVRRGRAVTRAGARPTPDARTARGRLVRRQLRPEPRVGWGLALAESRLATSLIDLSDGLSSDLTHLCQESGTGARLDAALIPVDRDAARALRLTPAEALGLALGGGEDFELLFTVSPRNAARLPAEVGGVGASRVGVVTDEPGRVVLVEGGRARPLRASGFRHF